MRKSRFLDAPFLKGLFAELREKAHPVYALLCAMPRDVFYIFRDYDFRKRLETYRNPEGYMLTLSEFLENADSYDPQDEFCIYFEGIGEEEDSGRPGRVDICTRDNATCPGDYGVVRGISLPSLRNGPARRRAFPPDARARRPLRLYAGGCRPAPGADRSLQYRRRSPPASRVRRAEKSRLHRRIMPRVRSGRRLRPGVRFGCPSA